MTTDIVGRASGAPLPRLKLNGWTLAALCVAGVVLVPVVMIFAIAVKAGFANGLVEISGGVLTRTLTDTAKLLLGVMAFATVAGVFTAWVVVHFEFPGRRWLGWALILPFAVPTYISAYAWVEAFDYFGPVQSALRQVFGFRTRADYWFPDVRSMGGAIIITGLVLYPYVYVAARAAFTMQGSSLDHAARSLGCSRFEALRRVVLPVIWPAVAAGLTDVLMITGRNKVMVAHA